MEPKSLFKINEILPAIGGRLLYGNPEMTFNDFCIDSRYAEARTLFVPLMGQNRDGHQYVIDAISKGAVAAIVRSGHHQTHEILSWLHERSNRGGYDDLEGVCIIEVRHTLVALQKLAEWYRLRYDATVLGITGSVGKTGTKEMLIQILSAKWPTVGTEKNFNNEIGVPLALSKIASKTSMAVIEMAMRSRGEISLLSRIAHPNLSIITNTSGSHVGRLGSFEEVYKAKCEIVDGMADGSTVVLNLRDPNLNMIKEELVSRKNGPTKLDIKYFDPAAIYDNSGLPPFLVPGRHEEAPTDLPDPDVWMEDVEIKGLEGSTFKLCCKDGSVKVDMKMLGRGALENLCAATCAARALGMTLEEIADTIPTLLPAPQRLNLFQLKDNLYVIDDCYNSSPASVQDSLELLMTIKDDFRKIIILGDMLELGKFETLLHRQIALTTLNMPIHAVYAVGPRMNAVNEVEGRDDVELYYLEGHADYDRRGQDHRQEVRFGDTFGGSVERRRKTDTVILDDQVAGKLSALLLNQLEQDTEPTVILIKGSRALHLERIVNDLLSGIDE